MKLRIGAAAIVVAAACFAALGGSATAAVVQGPTIGQAYCIDGTFNVTSDEASAETAWEIVNENGGVFTVWQESEPGSDDTNESVLQMWQDYFFSEGEEDHLTPGDFTGEVEIGTVHLLTLGTCPAGAAPSTPPGVFLCYSADQTQPGVWPQDVAAQLLKQGYWLPYAVSGNQAGGTNLGGYNLVCNIASTQSVSDSFVGGDGTVLGPVYAGATIALYPKVGG